MNKLLKMIFPPEKWYFPVIIIIGIFTGLGAYNLYISNFASYLSDKPETCMNCHIMAPQYTTWQHSSHKKVAHCNDCHVPHNNILNKYYFKAKDGLRHASIFTLRAEPQVIFIKEEGKGVVQDNCVRCHEKLLKDDNLRNLAQEHFYHRAERKCWTCHRETPHGRVNSISSVPNARVPTLSSPVPGWIKNIVTD